MVRRTPARFPPHDDPGLAEIQSECSERLVSSIIADRYEPGRGDRHTST